MSRRKSQVTDGNTPAVSRRLAGRTPARVVSPPPAAPSPEPQGRQLQPVPMKTWVVASAHKQDQTAGFVAWAKVQSLGPLTMSEWEDAFSAFLKREVK